MATTFKIDLSNAQILARETEAQPVNEFTRKGDKFIEGEQKTDDKGRPMWKLNVSLTSFEGEATDIQVRFPSHSRPTFKMFEFLEIDALVISLNTYKGETRASYIAENVLSKNAAARMATPGAK